MTIYCITAANHESPNNHCASSFKVWKKIYDEKAKKFVWSLLGGKPISFVNELLANGNEVITGKLNAAGDEILEGAPVEIELRIAHNGQRYKISDMPTF